MTASKYLCLLCGLLVLGSSAGTARPKHILFLMIDDLGFNDVGYRNTSDLSSPNIDTLAKNGIRLERYYTHNLCSPSRTAFLSGRYASTIGMQGCVIINGQAVDLPRNVSTIADRLRSGGFATAAFGKWGMFQCCKVRCRGSRFSPAPVPPLPPNIFHQTRE